MAFVFDPVCKSNLSVQTDKESKGCAKITNYIVWTTIALIFSVTVMVSERNPLQKKSNGDTEYTTEQKMYYVFTGIFVCLVLAILTTPIASLIGKRLKEAQQIDVSRLSSKFDSSQAELASYANESVARLAKM